MKFPSSKHFWTGRGKARGSLPCKDLLLLAIGRGQGKHKYPVVQSLILGLVLPTCTPNWLREPFYSVYAKVCKYRNANTKCDHTTKRLHTRPWYAAVVAYWRDQEAAMCSSSVGDLHLISNQVHHHNLAFDISQIEGESFLDTYYRSTSKSSTHIFHLGPTGRFSNLVTLFSQFFIHRGGFLCFIARLDFLRRVNTWLFRVPMGPWKKKVKNDTLHYRCVHHEHMFPARLLTEQNWLAFDRRKTFPFHRSS